MALINHAKREINAKIVYYGREGAGKRVSLQYLYDRIKPSLRWEFKSVPAGGDELLFFDFSPFDNPVFGGYRIRFHMYCLTGRVANPAAWKMTLKGADGVVIVVDASPDMLPVGREGISSLRDFLSAYGVGLHDIPCVLQLNRNGNGPGVSGSDIAADLQVPDLQTFFSNSGSGEGVLKALSLLSRDVLDRIGQDDSLKQGGRKGAADETSGGGAPPVSKPEASVVTAAPVDLPLCEEAAVWSVLNRDDELADGAGGLKVVQLGEVTACGPGGVRIPLEISLGGVTRRLVVSIDLEQG